MLDLSDSARMFALVATATADAIIACWDSKIEYNFWLWRRTCLLLDADAC